MFTRVLRPPILHLRDIGKYGSMFTKKDRKCIKLEKWPQPCWRPVVDGVGGGVIRSVFKAEWNCGVYTSHNVGISNGEYSNVFSSLSSALILTPTCDRGYQIPPKCYVRSEINYHACGSQIFYSDSLFVLLLAKPGDDVKPDDFRALYVPPGVGVEVNSFVWHTPPILTHCTSGIVYTKQARVHSKIYYDPLIEDGVVFCVNLR
jgi:ureidoglycolate lyase